MHSRHSTFLKAVYRLFYVFLTSALSSTVFMIFIIDPGIDGYYRATFRDTVHGDAYKPYVYRALMPVTVRLIASALPQEVRDSIIDSNLHIAEWEQDILPEYWVASILMFASLVGFSFAFRQLLKDLFQAQPVFIDLIVLVAIAGLPPFFKYYNYVYDLPNLFLFTLGLSLMLRRDWRRFLIVFLIACVNKETTILLTAVFTIYYWMRTSQVPRSLFLRLLFAQAGIFLLVRSMLLWIFRNNPGDSIEFHFFDHNILLLLTPYSFSGLFLILSLATLIYYKWSEKPDFLKAALWLILPLSTSTLFFGYVDEIRVYYEVYPVILLLVSYSISDILGIKMITKLPVELSAMGTARQTKTGAAKTVENTGNQI
jgi:hypothetical protein